MKNSLKVRPRGTDFARVIQVIVTEGLIGSGTDDDPCRTQTRYWDFEGHLLAEFDPMVSGTQADFSQEPVSQSS